mmetsp:Transcript_100288/g.281007  ORF Transcript_100288/g.281007 Transcript_100288/m.281007 type:complete len:279 (+) Transcript_100288:22-858(+)
MWRLPLLTLCWVEFGRARPPVHARARLRARAPPPRRAGGAAAQHEARLCRRPAAAPGRGVDVRAGGGVRRHGILPEISLLQRHGPVQGHRRVRRLCGRGAEPPHLRQRRGGVHGRGHGVRLAAGQQDRSQVRAAAVVEDVRPGALRHQHPAHAHRLRCVARVLDVRRGRGERVAEAGRVRHDRGHQQRRVREDDHAHGRGLRPVPGQGGLRLRLHLVPHQRQGHRQLLRQGPRPVLQPGLLPGGPRRLLRRLPQQRRGRHLRRRVGPRRGPHPDVVLP